MVLNPTQWSNATSLVYLENTIRDRAGKNTWDWPVFYGKPIQTDEHEIKSLAYSGLGYPQERNALEDIQSEDMVEMGTTTLTASEYGLGVDIDRNLFEDSRQKGLKNKQDYMTKVGKSLGESYSQLKNVRAAIPFIRAFSTTNQTMWDGYSLCSDSYVSESGKSLDNKFPVVSHTFDTVWDKVLWMRNDQYSHKDLRRVGTPKYYLYHPSAEKDVRLIFTNKWKPETTDRDRNTLNDFNIKPLPCIELSDTGANFLIGEEFLQYCKFYTIRKMEVEYEDNKRNRSISVLSSCRWIIGVTHRDSIVGSPGS